MILHIPHSSVKVPDWIKFEKDITLDLERMTDWYTDQLFMYPAMDRIVFPYTRLACDVERFIDNEPMEAHGHGVCYIKDSFGNHLRNVTPDERERIINTLYKPHHAKLTQACNHALTLFDQVVLVDCHSFSDQPLLHESSKTTRPDWCIGTDPFHTPSDLVDEVVSLIENKGYTTKVNDPFAGTIIPEQHYHKNADLKSIMIEVNRKLYMHSPEQFKQTQVMITSILDVINSYEQR